MKSAALADTLYLPLAFGTLNLAVTFARIVGPMCVLRFWCLGNGSARHRDLHRGYCWR